MPDKCCVPGCNGNYDSGVKVSVFRFPLEKSLRRKWLRNFPRKKWSPTKWSAVCERHFEPHQFRPRPESSTRRKRPLLVAGAVPTIFPDVKQFGFFEESVMEESESESDDADQESRCLPPPLQVDVPDVTIKQECPDDDLLDNPLPEFGDNLVEKRSIKQEPMDTMQWEDADENNTGIVVKEEPPDEEECDLEYPSSPLGPDFDSDEQPYTQGEINDWTARKCKVEMQDELDDEPLVTPEQSSQDACPPLPQVQLQLVTMGAHQPGFRPLLPKGPPGTLLAAPILSSQGSLLLMRVISTAKEPLPLQALPKSTVFVSRGSATAAHSHWTSLIPKSFNTTIVEWSADEHGFKGKFRAALHSTSDCQEWLQQFEHLSNTNWVLLTSRGESGHFVLSRNYICHLGGWKKRRSCSDRSQGCKAALSFRVKRSTYYNKSRDPHMAKDLAGIVQVSFKHSHSLDIRAIGKWLRRRPWLRNAFFDYFEQGMTPAVAMRHHEDLVLAAEGVDHLYNRSINPPPGWVYQQYRLWRKAGEETIIQTKKQKVVSATVDATTDTTEVTVQEETSNVTCNSPPDGRQETSGEKDDATSDARSNSKPDAVSSGSCDATSVATPVAAPDTTPNKPDATSDATLDTMPDATPDTVSDDSSDAISNTTPDKAALCVVEDETRNAKNDATEELKAVVKSGTSTTPAQSNEVEEDSSEESVLESQSAS